METSLRRTSQLPYGLRKVSPSFDVFIRGAVDHVANCCVYIPNHEYCIRFQRSVQDTSCRKPRKKNPRQLSPNETINLRIM